MVNADLGNRPLDRALFAVFAELVRAHGNGRVADVGCGAGRVTILLSRLGLDAFGVDVSPGMVALARRTYPQLRFEQGSMLALDVPAGTLGGLLAYYSIIHIARERRRAVFTEFHRVLAPGGLLMLVFQIGDEQGHRTESSARPYLWTGTGSNRKTSRNFCARRASRCGHQPYASRKATKRLARATFSHVSHH